ncbi:MAG: hypothetical protein ACRCX4_04585 [Bacteroidales bacterium]
MDLGDYLYLIIFLGVALFQIVSKSFDKKQNNEQNAEKKNQSSHKKRKKIIKSEPASEYQKNDYIAEDKVFKSCYQPIAVTDDILQSEESKKMKDIPLNCKHNSLISNLSDKDELKKAFVYTEIFARKF